MIPLPALSFIGFTLWAIFQPTRKIIKNPVDDETKKKIIKDYGSGLSASKLAKKYNLNTATIYNYLNKWGVELNRPFKGTKQYSVEMAKKVFEMYNEGLSIKKIASDLNVSENTVSHFLKYYNYIDYPKNRISSLKIKLSDSEISEAALLYEKGLGLTNLASKFSVSTSTMRRLLSDFGVEIRPSPSTPKKELPIESILKDYANGLSLESLASKYKTSSSTIRNRLSDEGIKIAYNVKSRKSDKSKVESDDIFKETRYSKLKKKNPAGRCTYEMSVTYKRGRGMPETKKLIAEAWDISDARNKFQTQIDRNLRNATLESMSVRRLTC
jgi:transposase